jgi:hypothetical protein
MSPGFLDVNLTHFYLVDYTSMVKLRSIRGDGAEDAESSFRFLDSLRSHAIGDLHTGFLEYGITLKDFVIIKCRFKGEALPKHFLIPS